MFRTKEVKRRSQEEAWKAQIGILQQTLADVNDRLAEAQIEVDQIGMSAAKMDRSLTRVVDYAKETKEGQDKSRDMLHQLREEVGAVEEQLAALGQAYDLQRDFAEHQQQTLKNLMEQSKHYTGLSKSSTDTAFKGEEALNKVESSIAEMDVLLSSIGNLALQSAIDAGRLGDTGLPYVQTAEMIRQLAADFAGRTKDISSQIAEIMELYQEQGKTLHQFISLVRDNNVALGKIAAEAVGETKKAPLSWERYREHVKRYGVLMEELERMAQNCGAKQTAMMQEMESVGDCYMEQQDSTAKMEDRIHIMKRLLSEIDYQHDKE